MITDDIKNLISGSSKKFNSLSMDVTLEDTANRILDTGKDSVALQDAFRNTLSAIGTADKVDSFNSYGFNNDTLNWSLWLALYNDSWVFRRAIDKPAQDMVNSGFVLHGDEDYSTIYKMFSKYKFDMIKLLQWGSLFGGSVGVMMFDTISDEELALPINKAKIKGAHMKLYITDRWYGVSASTETVTNMRDIDYGKPKMYDITFADGTSHKVHHSYVLRYEHRTAPQLIKCGQLQGWGYAEGAHILNELSRDDQLKSSITSLVNKSLIEVIKMSGMRGVFMGTDSGNEEQLRKRLEMVNWGRSFNSLTFLDKEDEYEQREFSGISGLSQLLETNMWLVAAALEMQGILFGDLKGGLSQESDSLRRYAITIENRCNSYYRPVLQKLLSILFIINDLKGSVDFDFISLIKDELNNDKMDSISKYLGILNSMVEGGYISKYQSAKSLQNYINNNALNIEFSDEYLEMLQINEKYDILNAYKDINNSDKNNILKSQFPEQFNQFNGSEESTGNELPDRLQYLSSDNFVNESPEAKSNEGKEEENL